MESPLTRCLIQTSQKSAPQLFSEVNWSGNIRFWEHLQAKCTSTHTPPPAVFLKSQLYSHFLQWIEWRDDFWEILQAKGTSPHTPSPVPAPSSPWGQNALVSSWACGVGVCVCVGVCIYICIERERVYVYIYMHVYMCIYICM